MYNEIYINKIPTFLCFVKFEQSANAFPQTSQE